MSTFVPSQETPVPEDFAQEVTAAQSSADAAKLILLSVEVADLEVADLPWRAAGLQLVETALLEANRQAHPKPLDRLVLFTGHRIDKANREAPRFPPSAEPVARAAIRAHLLAENQAAAGPMLAVAGGANGGDIIFLELCRELHIPAEMLLALPTKEYAAASVKSDQGGWLSRFEKLLAVMPPPHILADSKKLPAWLKAKEGYDIWQRNNLWLVSYALAQRPAHFTLIALWDGNTGDGPGGTENMVSIARQHGAKIVQINTKQLFGLDN